MIGSKKLNQGDKTKCPVVIVNLMPSSDTFGRKHLHHLRDLFCREQEARVGFGNILPLPTSQPLSMVLLHNIVHCIWVVTCWIEVDSTEWKTNSSKEELALSLNRVARNSHRLIKLWPCSMS